MNPQPARTQLLSIIAHARAGALDHAWTMYGALGPGLEADPAALAVKGRLLKDLALRASGAERQRLYCDAADAYLKAAEAGAATYPLINAATLWLLCGEHAQSEKLARDTLDRIDRHPDEPETPYYRAATRAEALLLLDRVEDAQNALAEAIALAPMAWEDHASTLRQFAIILAAQGRDPAWLDPHRPPRSLHFGGHMAFRADPGPTALAREIAAVLEAERVGFGYGALAAGADIIVAEALIERGAALHVILPGGVNGFAAVSVDPHGPDWRRRFDAALAHAETVRAVEPHALPDEAMIALADEIAMGSSLINARLLASEAIQLLVLPEPGEGGEEGASARSRDAWSQLGRRQHIIRAPREPVDVPPDMSMPATRRRTAALSLRAAFASEEKTWLAVVKTVLERCPMPDVPAAFTGRDVELGYDDIVQAARAATTLAGEALRVGGHYGIADHVEDPFTGTLRLVGRAIGLAAAAAASAPAGTVCITEDFAAALAAAAPDSFRAECVGELGAAGGETPIGLFALKPLS
jgi:tetratricopeptide (TPR) repeat protein